MIESDRFECSVFWRNQRLIGREYVDAHARFTRHLADLLGLNIFVMDFRDYTYRSARREGTDLEDKIAEILPNGGRDYNPEKGFDLELLPSHRFNIRTMLSGAPEDYLQTSPQDHLILQYTASDRDVGNSDNVRLELGGVYRKPNRAKILLVECIEYWKPAFGWAYNEQTLVKEDQDLDSKVRTAWMTYFSGQYYSGFDKVAVSDIADFEHVGEGVLLTVKSESEFAMDDAGIERTNELQRRLSEALTVLPDRPEQN